MPSSAPASPPTRTQAKVSHAPMGKPHTPDTAACDVEALIKLIEGRWKLVLLFHVFDGQVRRYSDLERLVPGISQKMPAQQLRQLERDGLVLRTVYAQVPPQVDYRLTAWGQALCPALEAMLTWGEARNAVG